MDPSLQGGTGQAQVQSCLPDRVTRHRAGVLPTVEVDHLAHASKVPQRRTAFPARLAIYFAVTRATLTKSAFIALSAAMSLSVFSSSRGSDSQV